jgi:hypothetical protein
VGSVFIENGPGPYVSIGWVLDKADHTTRLKSGAIRQQKLATPRACRDFRPTGLGRIHPVFALRLYRTYFLTARIKDELCRFHW